MEDYLLTLSGSFVDTDSGEVLSNFQFHKPLSLFNVDDYKRYFDSFIRGVRHGRKVALYLHLVNDRELPKFEQKELF